LQGNQNGREYDQTAYGQPKGIHRAHAQIYKGIFDQVDGLRADNEAEYPSNRIIGVEFHQNIAVGAEFGNDCT